MSPMILYAIGSVILVLTVGLSYPVEAMALAGVLFMVAALARAIEG